MGCRDWVGRLGLMAGVLWAVWPAGVAHAQAGEKVASTAAASPSFARASSPARALSLTMAQTVPVNELSADVRESVRRVLEEPTITTRGPIEVFRGRPALYHWLLNHPDRAVLMWRKLGAKCVDITSRPQGRFGWKDSNGSDLAWETVYDGPSMRVWYAEGVASPGLLWPTVPVRAVAVLHHTENIDALGRTLIHHEADLYVQTDSKTAALIAKVLGSTAPHLARQCAAQLELFFSGMVWYLELHPERAESLLMGNLPPASPAAQELRQLLIESGIREQSAVSSRQ